MKATVEVRPDYDLVVIDMTDEDAAAASAVGRKKQEAFAIKAAFLLTGATEAEVWYIRGKRGVSNRGFRALVRVDR